LRFCEEAFPQENKGTPLPLWVEIQEFLKTAGNGLRADRERALLCVACDTMARRSEFLAFDGDDIEFMPNGSGTILIRRSKTDAAGAGCSSLPIA
jgi:hypothetical protein